MAPKKQIHINFFDMTCTGSHMAVGLWQNEGDNSRTKDTVDYYTWMAKLADKGKISCIFFADTYGGHETYQGKSDAAYRSGGSVGQTDPTIWVSAMAAASKNVSFGITGSTSYINPFILARTWSTLDHATQGRVAWNVVTSYSNASAKAMGKDSITPKHLRYEEAHEYMDLCYSLWEGSWEDGAQTWKRPEGAYDPSKIHKINFKGKHHNTSAYGATHPSPQRTPVIFQAGGSPQGKAFAAKHAEAIFCGGGGPADIAIFIKEMREMAVAQGRAGTDLNFFPSVTPIVGRTVEEAQAKYEKYKSLVDWEGGLAKLSGYLNLDLSKYPLDEPFDYSEIKDGVAIEGVGNTIKKDKVPLTPRQLGERMAFCGGGNMPVGTPDMIADAFEEWINVGDIDGFNVAYVSNPASYEDFVELVVPVLMERGIMWKDYAVPGGTFRENLRREPGTKRAPSTHPAAKFRYNVLKEKYADENGDIHIDYNVVDKSTEKTNGFANGKVNGKINGEVNGKINGEANGKANVVV